MPADHHDEIHSFEDFYATRIEPLRQDHKSKGNSYATWGLLLLFFGALFVLSIVVAANGGESGLFCFITFALMVFSIYKLAIANDSYVGGFKSMVIKEIIDFVLPGSEYKPHSFISTRFFRASCLYRYRVKDITGDDYIKAAYKNVSFQASELASYGNDEDTKDTRGWRLFNGIFFTADLGTFSGGTYIWQKNNVQIGNSVADEHYRLYPIPSIYKIQTGSEQFDKYYTVYSSYPAEAHSILSESMMQRILSFRKQINRDISISFVAGRCYVAIPFSEKLLEPVDDLADKEGIKQLFFTILLYPAIINQLKLYEYI